MPKQLHLSAIVTLSDDMFDRAAAVSAIRKPWGELLDALNSAGLKPEAKCEELETRAKPGPRTGQTKPRGSRAPAAGAETTATAPAEGAAS